MLSVILICCDELLVVVVVVGECGDCVYFVYGGLSVVCVHVLFTIRLRYAACECCMRRDAHQRLRS